VSGNSRDGICLARTGTYELTNPCHALGPFFEWSRDAACSPGLRASDLNENSGACSHVGPGGANTWVTSVAA
jgi:hypothetical protein